MPGVTPNFAIRYPCSGEQINCTTTFRNWATDIDSALSTVDAASQRAQRRPRVSLVTDAAGFSVPVNLPMTMQFTTKVFDTGLATGAAPYIGFGPASSADNGIYLFSAEFSPVNTATTVVSWKAWIVAENRIVAQRNSGDSSGAGTAASRMNVAGLGLMTTVNPALAFFQWTGTGGPMAVYCNFSAAYVAAP